jgi:outer membrane receptor protein involved in Fe transport
VGDISGNRALKPSYVHTIEGQVTYRPASFIVVTTGVAYSYILDQAQFAQVGVNQVAQNVAQVESISWESELKLDWRKRLAVYGNLSLNRTRHRSDTEGFVAELTAYRNPAYPPIVFNAGASAAIPRVPLRLSVEGSLVSARQSSGTNTLELGQRYALPSYSSLGASLRTMGLELLERRETTLVLTCRNILNTQAADPGFSGVDYPRMGRSIFVQLLQEL